MSHLAKMIQIKTQIDKKPFWFFFFLIVWKFNKLPFFLKCEFSGNYLTEVFLWFLFWEAPDLGTYCQKLCKVTAFIKSLALWVDSLELSTVHVFSVADIVFCLLQTECLALSAFFSFFPLSLKPTHASRWKDDLYLNGLVLFCDFHIHVQYKKQGQQQPPFSDQSISGHRCDID